MDGIKCGNVYWSSVFAAHKCRFHNYYFFIAFYLIVCLSQKIFSTIILPVYLFLIFVQHKVENVDSRNVVIIGYIIDTYLHKFILKKKRRDFTVVYFTFEFCLELLLKFRCYLLLGIGMKQYSAISRTSYIGQEWI